MEEKASRERKKKPSKRQARAIAISGENGGNFSRAMIDAGYSKKTAHNPAKLTESRAFQDLVDKELPDEDLLKVHKEGLHAMEGKEQEMPDHQTRHKYLVTGYQLKGKLKSEPNGPLVALQFNIEEQRNKYK